jgi:hypothetical protein
MWVEYHHDYGGYRIDLVSLLYFHSHGDSQFVCSISKIEARFSLFVSITAIVATRDSYVTSPGTVAMLDRMLPVSISWWP